MSEIDDRTLGQLSASVGLYSVTPEHKGSCNFVDKKLLAAFYNLVRETIVKEQSKMINDLINTHFPSNEMIRDVFVENGFPTQSGTTELEPHVYDAVRNLMFKYIARLDIASTLH